MLPGFCCTFVGFLRERIFQCTRRILQLRQPLKCLCVGLSPQGGRACRHVLKWPLFPSDNICESFRVSQHTDESLTSNDSSSELVARVCEFLKCRTITARTKRFYSHL